MKRPLFCKRTWPLSQTGPPLLPPSLWVLFVHELTARIKIAERESATRFQDLAILFHVAPVFVKSNFSAIVRCEYLVHAQNAQLFSAYAL